MASEITSAENIYIAIETSPESTLMAGVNLPAKMAGVTTTGKGTQMTNEVTPGEGTHWNTEFNHEETQITGKITPRDETRITSEITPGEETLISREITPGEETQISREITPGEGTQISREITHGEGTQMTCEITDEISNQLASEITSEEGNQMACDIPLEKGNQIIPETGNQMAGEITPAEGSTISSESHAANDVKIVNETTFGLGKEAIYNKTNIVYPTFGFDPSFSTNAYWTPYLFSKPNLTHGEAPHKSNDQATHFPPTGYYNINCHYGAPYMAVTSCYPYLSAMPCPTASSAIPPRFYSTSESSSANYLPSHTVTPDFSKPPPPISTRRSSNPSFVPASPCAPPGSNPVPRTSSPDFAYPSLPLYSGNSTAPVKSARNTLYVPYQAPYQSSVLPNDPGYSHQSSVPPSDPGYAHQYSVPPSDPGYEHQSSVPPSDPGYEHQSSVPPSDPGYEHQSSVPPSDPGYKHQSSVPPSDPGYAHQSSVPPSNPGYAHQSFVPQIDPGYSHRLSVKPSDPGYAHQCSVPPSNPGYSYQLSIVPPSKPGCSHQFTGLPNNQGYAFVSSFDPAIDPGYSHQSSVSPSDSGYSHQSSVLYSDSGCAHQSSAPPSDSEYSHPQSSAPPSDAGYSLQSSAPPSDPEYSYQSSVPPIGPGYSYQYNCLNFIPSSASSSNIYGSCATNFSVPPPGYAGMNSSAPDGTPDFPPVYNFHPNSNNQVLNPMAETFIPKLELATEAVGHYYQSIKDENPKEKPLTDRGRLEPEGTDFEKIPYNAEPVSATSKKICYRAPSSRSSFGNEGVSNAYVSSRNQSNYISASFNRSKVPKRKRDLICGFCIKNGERDYHHRLKDGNGNVVCPVLRKVVCAICGATGDNAHTYSYCHVENKPENPPPLSTAANICTLSTSRPNHAAGNAQTNHSTASEISAARPRVAEGSQPHSSVENSGSTGHIVSECVIFNPSLMKYLNRVGRPFVTFGFEEQLSKLLDRSH